jgi:protein-disulfide isomerase
MSSTPRESKKTTREKAAEARAAQQAAERRRERTVRIVGAVVVVAVVASIIGVAVWQSSSNSSGGGGGATATADPGAALPKGVLPADDPQAFGVPYGTAPATAPVLEIWEDFQCPACGQVERTNGAGIEQVAADGNVRLIWRPTTFLDRNLGNDASARAVAAWGCAIDQGKAKEYHNLVYANQPETEGDGWTDDQLLAFGKEAGLSGAAYDTFQTCYTDRTYLGWAANSTQAFYDANIPGTPNALLNGKELANSVLVDQQALEQAIKDASS